MRQARVGIVGGTGYTGAELVRLLAGHPGAELACISSRQHCGAAVAAMFPSLRGVTDLCFGDPEAAELRDCDVVFFATPHGVAMQAAPALLNAGVRVVDLSADFRLRDATVFERWYGMPHAAPETLAEAVYGLPELMREAVAGARLVANPGCYPTSVQLGFAPLLAAGLAAPESLVADVKSGVTGAGREAKTASLFSENHDSFRAYGAGGHRHGAEVNQELSRLAGAAVDCVFVPHLLPIQRGIHATLHARLLEARDLQALYEDFFRDEPFVDVLPAGALPETRNVRGSNRCQIAVVPQSGRRVTVCAVIDNLVKGASGQAIQNMNLMLGLDEAAGLDQPALWP
jgi:N-acetyl-gamma-glutamyl-phosphate reductase